MVRLNRCLFVLLALIFSAAPLFAAEEDRAFNIATNKFNSGFYELAEKDFAAFTEKFPQSPRVPQAILFQAESKFFSQQFSNAVDLLVANKGRAGGYESQYFYWIGRAQFENKNFAAAADAFDELLRKFPNAPQRLDVVVREAASLARLQQWPRVVELLQQRDGVFQHAISTGASGDTVASGYLLLGEAQLAQNDFAGAEAVLQLLNPMNVSSDAKWRSQFLEGRLRRAQGRWDDALGISTNLAVLSADVTNRAESVDFQAGILEQMKRFDEATTTYLKNLGETVPTSYQNRAILKIADLDFVQGKLGEAVQTLQKFLDQFPGSPAADMATLTLGELRLKQALASVATNTASVDTNLLQRALSRFDSVLTAFTNSPLAGEALLGKGWCLWNLGRPAESLEVFRDAAEQLPVSKEQAEARFKWADAQFQLKDFAGALTNYNYVAENYAEVPEVREQFTERALYQAVRAALNADDLTAATAALGKILAQYPNGFAGDRALLLTGQGLSHDKDTGAARELFAEVEKRFPDSPLIPEVRLAVARSYEQDANWQSAITNYETWISAFTNNADLPKAEFSRAWDTYMVGHETNAMMLFTNFIATFPTNELAARAQWWLGDFYFRQNDFQNAENNYQLIFQNTNWPVSRLTYEAKMMAGRAAVQRIGYKDAIAYFTNLTSDLNCPADLRSQATFAYGDALMSQTSTNKAADFADAISVFKSIPLNYGTNSHTVLAWGKIGDCYLQLAAKDPSKYNDAIASYQQLLNFPDAGMAVHNQAEFGLASVAEKQAAANTNAEQQTALLKAALDHYLNVFADDEQKDPYWVKRSGLEALRLAETLQQWQQMENVCERLQKLLPVLQPMCEKKIAKAQEHLGKS